MEPACAGETTVGEGNTVNVTVYYLGASGSETLCSSTGMTHSDATIEIGRSGRTMSGRKVKDITSTKRMFVLSYGKTTGDVLQAYQNIYAIGGELNLIRINVVDGTENFAVMMEPIEFQAISGRGYNSYHGLYSFQVILDEV